MIKMSDYRASFFAITHVMALIPQNYVFVTSNGQVELQETQGYDIQKPLPLKFVEQNEMELILSALPLSTQAIECHSQELSLLFTEQQLRLIHSYYFGANGPTHTKPGKTPY
ncbi:hypothetical protein BCV72DRAFT_49415 [Rhizopus microsporus var. microsporus]|uniref:Uncharacterized protein n=1 Tax=Rhizopus microsporus var. microsporus TaxID=86635 RepID=A0A1X0QRR8_RHIZD|nr:hypothetical protein BCV72DRAFT_49415 [Rhizopus microsporus var. microsporus]